MATVVAISVGIMFALLAHSLTRDLTTEGYYAISKSEKLFLEWSVYPLGIMAAISMYFLVRLVGKDLIGGLTKTAHFAIGSVLFALTPLLYLPPLGWLQMVTLPVAVAAGLRCFVHSAEDRDILGLLYAVLASVFAVVIQVLMITAHTD